MARAPSSQPPRWQTLLNRLSHANPLAPSGERATGSSFGIAHPHPRALFHSGARNAAGSDQPGPGPDLPGVSCATEAIRPVARRPYTRVAAVADPDAAVSVDRPLVVPSSPESRRPKTEVQTAIARLRDVEAAKAAARARREAERAATRRNRHDASSAHRREDTAEDEDDASGSDDDRRDQTKRDERRSTSSRHHRHHHHHHHHHHRPRHKHHHKHHHHDHHTRGKKRKREHHEHRDERRRHEEETSRSAGPDNRAKMEATEERSARIERGGERGMTRVWSKTGLAGMMRRSYGNLVSLLDDAYGSFLDARREP